MRHLILAVTALLMLLPLDLVHADQVDAILDQGEKQLRRRDWGAAKATFEKARETSPGSVNAHVGYQEAVLRSGDAEGLQVEPQRAARTAAQGADEALDLVARLVLQHGTKPGQQVGGLRIRRELGRGAYGIVYLAEDEELHRPVAVKVLHRLDHEYLFFRGLDAEIRKGFRAVGLSAA